MYDDDVRAIAPHHWYDEPPYESDPEDFLMGLGNGQPAATIQNGRLVTVIFYIVKIIRFYVLFHRAITSFRKDCATSKSLYILRAKIYPLKMEIEPCNPNSEELKS